ncbi:MAG TPA: DUF3017 domain-containing protein [Mycobacteriales bacterium]|nr:DUF3017 domain-containing protein [Mycobacteriales bacterium]
MRSARRAVDPLIPVLAVGAVGILLAALHHARSGMWVVTVALAAAAVLRLVLDERAAGSLIVRGKRLDVAVLTALAVALGVMAAVTP